METILPLLKAALQVAILFIVINQVLYYLRNTRGSLVLCGVLIGVIALAFAANTFELPVIKHILSNLYGSAMLGLLIIFQPELRRSRHTED